MEPSGAQFPLQTLALGEISLKLILDRVRRKKSLDGQLKKSPFRRDEFERTLRYKIVEKKVKSS